METELYKTEQQIIKHTADRCRVLKEKQETARIYTSATQ